MSLFTESSQEDIQKAVEEFNDEVVKRYVDSKVEAVQGRFDNLTHVIDYLWGICSRIDSEIVPKIKDLQRRVEELEDEVRALGGNI